jgi:hypothetical protein
MIATEDVDANHEPAKKLEADIRPDFMITWAMRQARHG